jgi:nitrate reductase assembly molybdenum cofactor insertion protein NarJ
MKVRNQYNLLANLFRYPKDGYADNVNETATMLKENYPEAYKEIKPFVDIVNSNTLFETEEIFGQTFHIQAICFLDLGYVLFGEDYKRGAFLVQMKNEQRIANNDCGEELADNLPNVLKLMMLIEDQEFLEEMAVRVVIRAMKKMLEDFDISRISLKQKVMKKKQKVIILEDLKNKNIYQHAIQATLNVLQSDFKGITYNDDDDEKRDLAAQFLANCGTCSTNQKPVKTN